MIPDLDRVTSPAYLANMVTRPITDIRAMRAECRKAFAENPLELSLREGVCGAVRP